MIREAALSLLHNGFSVIPCHPNKRPAISSWKAYQQAPMTPVEAENFFLEVPV